MESTPDFESPEYGEEDILVVECMQLAQEAIMDEEEGIDRSDLWYVEWDELQASDEGYMDMSERVMRQNATNEINTLYTTELLRMYPHLNEVTSPEEMMIEMAMIPDLPACHGYFFRSDYQADDGGSRTITYVMVGLGIRMAINVIVSDENSSKAYSLRLDSEGMLYIGVGDVVKRNEDETGMLSAVHPSQTANLQSVLDGTAKPFEVDTKLIEIRVFSEEDTDPDVLEDILTYAREQYGRKALERAAAERAEPAEPLIDNLRAMHGILVERSRQLYPDM